MAAIVIVVVVSCCEHDKERLARVENTERRHSTWRRHVRAAACAAESEREVAELRAAAARGGCRLKDEERS